MSKKLISLCIFALDKNLRFEDSMVYKFIKPLEDKYDFIYDTKNPKYIFCDEHDVRHLKYKNAIKIQWSVENVPANFFEFDYLIGISNLKFGDRYYRYPLYCFEDYRYLLNGINDFSLMNIDELQKKEHFCNFIYSNPNCSKERIDWFNEIGKYKFVHAPGSLCHNTDPIPKGETWEQTFELKTEYQRNFKFSLAFENTSSPGYISEKIFNAFRARTIPIYWGDPDIEILIDERSFINLGKCNGYAEAIDKIREVDENDELYLNMVNTPPLKKVDESDFDYWDNGLTAFLDNIFSKEYGKRNIENKLWDYRYEMRYINGAIKYERHNQFIHKMYEIYKRIKL